MIELRPYQTEAVEGVRNAFRRGARAPLLCAPTGAGKTVMFSYVAHGASGKGQRVLILAHRKELIRQASRKLSDAGISHGIIAPGFTPSDDLVQVASVQTLQRRLRDPRYSPPDLIVIDEAHHAVAGQWATVVAAYPRARILGVTATPERLDGRGLGVAHGGPFDTLVMGPTVRFLIDNGFLTPTRVFAPADGPDLTGIRTRGGDYEVGSLSAAMSGAQLVGDAVEHYAKHASGQPAILFSPSVAHAETMAAAFRAKGWRATAASGASASADRDAAINGLATGAVQVLCSCDLISEGLDVPAVGCVILMRPTKSLGLYLQQVGRGLRPAPGKSHLVVLDHAGCSLQHGMIEADRQWNLEGRDRKAKAPSTRQCKACFAVFDGRSCPECGWAPPAASAEPREIEHVPGELQEVTGVTRQPDDPRTVELRTQPLKSLTRWAAGDRDRLNEIARARGYRQGWVWHQQCAWRYRQQARGAA